ncbi:MAG: hypothetical protein EXR54_04960 [Dehalococcoidia bacterium]|nr:hypothetical protein [Dehalococcoidia bacterium]MSQ16902.1 hypothetical protein [Dehalococcoidia bacterium]
MATGHHRCESCGSELGASQNGSALRASGIPYDARRDEGDRRLREYAEAMDQVAGQLAALRQAVQAGVAGGEQVLQTLDALSQQLRQRHGLCIQRECIVCRAQEQAIKDHVVLYIDWKVPGTMEKLEQARRGT